MYKKAITSLVLVNLLFLFSYLCIMGLRENRARTAFAAPVCEMKFDEIFLSDKDGGIQDNGTHGSEEQGGGDCDDTILGITAAAASGQRVVDCETLEKAYKYNLGEEDFEALCRIVEAEAGTEDEDGKLLVANVVLNRVEDEQFPDTVKEVVLQKENGVSQFSPVANGRYFQVEISEETLSAVERALEGEDISQGALYFAAREYADSERMKWFDYNLAYLFKHGGHEFYTSLP